MTQERVYDVVLRPKRQLTIPKRICDELGIKPGDSLKLTVDDSILIARPKKTIALEALKEIRDAFRRSIITGAGTTGGRPPDKAGSHH
jgi:AbrB family looped-hinge helix DNA binding protein